MTSVLTREERRHRHREGHANIEAEMGVIQSQAKGHLQSQEARKESPLEISERIGPTDTLISNFWSLNCER